jgi:hypothetical protein
VLSCRTSWGRKDRRSAYDQRYGGWTFSGFAIKALLVEKSIQELTEHLPRRYSFSRFALTVAFEGYHVTYEKRHNTEINQYSNRPKALEAVENQSESFRKCRNSEPPGDQVAAKSRRLVGQLGSAQLGSIRLED